MKTMLAYDMALDAPGCHRGLPSTRLVLVLAVAEPICLGWHGRAGSGGSYWSCLSGLHPTPADIHHRPRLTGIQLDLAPAAARDLLGLPAGELSGVLGRDADTMIGWLTAVGFTEHAIYRSPDDPAVVGHAEMVWPAGGGIMFGTHHDGNPDWPSRPGTAAAYLITDDPDRVHAAAVAAGADILQELRDEDYGSRGFAVRDPEGNLWSFGTYRP